jgi:hypothetical protein
LARVVLMATHLRKRNVLAKISEEVRGCRGGASDAPK